MNKFKKGMLGLVASAAMALNAVPASAQLPIAIPLSSFGLDSVGGLGGLGDLSALPAFDLGGLPALGELPLSGGGLPGLDGLGGLTASAGLPPFLSGVLNGGAETLLALGVDVVSDILAGGGVAEIPLIGLDIDNFLSPAGFVAGLEGLATDYSLPIGIPVLERSPAQLYLPVVFSALATQGLPVGTGAPPLPADILSGNFGGFGIGGLGSGDFGLDGVLALLAVPALPLP